MDYYETLGLGRNASQEDITVAYRKLALLYHPDRNLDNPEAAAVKFKEIAKAFETLNVPHQRDQYDRGRLKDKPTPPPKPRRQNKYQKANQRQQGRPFYDQETGRWYDSPEQKAAGMAVYAPRPLSDYTPTPPKFDIWGRPLSKEEQAEWLREQTTPGMMKSPPKRRDPNTFYDAYEGQYGSGDSPSIR